MTPDPKARFTDFVRKTIARYDLLPRLAKARQPRETVVVGTSGGPDSVALLRVLAALAKKELAVTLIAAHVNHGLRGAAADEDQAFVAGLARQMGLPCEAARIDVRAEAQALGLGIEEAGRLVRRRFLAETARKHGARKVALAHHADDRAETVLFNILRGTGIEGLASLKPRAPLLCDVARPACPAVGQAGDIPPRPGKPAVPHGAIEIIRPLIDTPRDLVLGYLDAISQPYREDETNRTDAYTRNRIRNTLLPLLAKEFNPKVEEALVRLSEQASAAGEVLADALDEVWRKIVREMPAEAKKVSGTFSVGTVPGSGDSPPEKVPDTFFVIDADDFVGLRAWMQGALIRRAVSLLGGGLKHMSAERTREVVDALLAKTIVGPIDLPGGLVAARNRRAIRIGRRAKG
ncbi:MAG: tRNA lysidine(34) synthetase TilS [Planctomycetota bacterium]|nr:tRNA lysidine(34) synthetase TilS [Planctomycetota bacterium]